jgi:hypothetical protein
VVACKITNFGFCYFDFRSICVYEHQQLALYDSEKKEWIGGIAKLLME